MAAASAALLIGALLSAVGLASTSVDRAVAAGQNCTVPSPLLFNTGGGGDRLYSYDPTTGAQESSVPLAQDYGDIAITSAGVLYGASFNSYSLDTIDPATGAVTSTIAIDIPNGQGDLNALSALPNGDLLAGLSYNSTVYDVDPTTGHATVFTTLPSGYESAGDFLSLADGDILASTNANGSSYLVRIHPDKSTTVVGSIPESYGAAQSAGTIFLAGSNGDVYSLNSVPTAASTAAIAVTTVASTGLPFYGATSVGDAGECSALVTSKSVSPSGTVQPGQTLTYTLTFDNSAGGAITNALDYTDHLGGVLDDATITTAPALASGSGLSVSAVSGGAFTVTGQVPANTTSTVTYSVKVNAPDTGDHALTNYLIPTGTSVPSSCVSSDPDCTSTSVTSPALTLQLTADQPAIPAAGQTVTYSYKVTNTGNTPLNNIVINQSTFSGSGTLPPATCPSGPLAPQASITCTAAYTVTAADVASGTLTQTASSTGTPTNGASVTSGPSTVTLLAQLKTLALPADNATPASVLASTGLTTVAPIVAISAGVLAAGIVLLILGWRRRQRGRHI